MKTLDAGVAYSIWVSFGSIGALVVGSLVYGEKLNTKQMIRVAFDHRGRYRLKNILKAKR